MQREIELCRGEKKLKEDELDLARREIEFLKSMQQLTIGGNNQAINTPRPMYETTPRLTASMIADMLNYFDGNSETYETWERQVRLLKTTYQVTDEMVKLAISSRLRGKAFEWFHSRPECIVMTVDELLGGLREMFYHEPSKIHLRREFERRIWKREEAFSQYMHEKVIMANRLGMSDGEMVDYIIEGIPDFTLRNIARAQRLNTKTSLLEAFGKVSLYGKSSSMTYPYTRREENTFRPWRTEERTFQPSKVEERAYRQPRSNDRAYGPPRVEERPLRPSRENDRLTSPRIGEYQRREVPISINRCFNCGMEGHYGMNCPLKNRGAKCFKCQAFGHVAANCLKKDDVKDVCNISGNTREKYYKKVRINEENLTALIDTGSDLSVMRAEQYVRIGSPPLLRREITFCGIGSQSNKTIGKFNAQIEIDGNQYPINIWVISDTLMQHDLIIGTDFLNTVEMNIKRGEISIRSVEKENQLQGCIPEIYKIDCIDEASEIDLSNIVNTKHRGIIRDLMKNYEPVKTRETGIKMTITVKDDEPIYQKARRLSPFEKEEVDKHVKQWLANSIVQPSLSDYASPVVLVKKKDGTTRLCVDYRKLNTKIIKDRYPLPLIEDQLDALQGSRVFSTLDLKNGFFHVPIDRDSRKYTAFIVPDGQYEFLYVPFGLCNSPAVFQKFINVVFKELTNKKKVIIYMDDLIIPSLNYEDGVENLKMVLRVAEEFGLNINWKKCSFLQTRIEFLGHIIEDGSIRPSERKTEAVMKFPQPQNFKQNQSFLGLAGYFRKFIPNYSIIARPLTNLLKSNVNFHFGEEEKFAFTKLKTILSNGPVLKLYRLQAETELHTDASMYGFGAILLQRDSDDNKFYPVYFASGKTTPAESRYSSYELEVLAIVKALRKFRVYLLGISFKIVTDCQAFTLTMRKRDLCVRVARWALLLEEFNYKIEHRAGNSLKHVDALSRNPLPACMLVDECEDSIITRIRKAQCEDESLKPIFEAANVKQLSGFVVRNGLLFKEVENDVKLIVPRSMQTQIIRRVHENGHFGSAKTEILVRKDYWFTDLKSKVEKIVRNCVPCILAERKHGRQEGFLHSIDKGNVPLDAYHVDHLGPLPSTRKSYKHIFVVVDAFSKFVWLYATKTTATAEVIEWLKKQSAIFGNPRRIISDRGTAFTSHDFREYCKSEAIEHILITTGMPRANGQVERVNRTLIPIVTKLSAPKPEEWYRYLDITQKFLNATPHRSIGTTPFRLLFGVCPRIKDNPDIRELIEKEWVDMFQSNREELRNQAKESILKIQRENRRGYDKRRKKARQYREGELVAIKRTQCGPGLKFASKYLGPYRVEKILRNDRFIVYKVGEHEGPQQTSTSAEYMKPWINEASDVSSSEE